jgi:hypothetical protein
MYHRQASEDTQLKESCEGSFFALWSKKRTFRGEEIHALRLPERSA